MPNYAVGTAAMTRLNWGGLLGEWRRRLAEWADDGMLLERVVTEGPWVRRGRWA
jgi:hypothetical protein